MDNLLSNLPKDTANEVFQTLVESRCCRIERIVSFGQATAQGQWYDQDEHEWVLLLSGSAQLSFADGRVLALKPGDYVNIPAHERHRVERTAENEHSVWLAIFYR